VAPLPFSVAPGSRRSQPSLTINRIALPASTSAPLRSASPAPAASVAVLVAFTVPAISRRPLSVSISTSPLLIVVPAGSH
jgi:hypothetical protein